MNFKTNCLLAVGMVAIMVGCGSSNNDNNTPTTVAVSSVAVTGTATVVTGSTTALTATVLPANATEKSVTWTSATPAVATVSATGVVSGLTAGTSVITATSVSTPAVKGTLTVTVSNPNVAVTSISVTGTATLVTGATTTLTAAVLPADATDKSVTWTSSANGVASVSTSGVVTGVTAGTATITAASVSTPSVSGSFDVTVSAANVDVTGVAVSGPSSVAINGAAALTATVLPANATNKAVTWSSDTMAVATVSTSGVVSGLTAGTATITATSVSNTSVLGTLKVTVLAPVYLYADLNATDAMFGVVTNGKGSHNSDATFDVASIDFASEGNHSMKLDPGASDWAGGFLVFGAVDLSTAQSITFSINFAHQAPRPTGFQLKFDEASMNPAYTPAEPNANTIDVMTYTPVSKTGDWETYTIPISDFTSKTGGGWHNIAINCKDVVDIGWWNVSVETGPVYIDNVYFTPGPAVPVVTTSYLYSEANATDALFGALSSGGNSANKDEVTTIDSAAVAGAEGTKTTSFYVPTGNAWGGGDIAWANTADLSGYTSVTFSLNVSALSALTFTKFEVKLEEASINPAGKDSGGAGPNGNSMNIANYASTAVTVGNWTTYTVPLADFKNILGIGYDNIKIDLKDVKNIGFWNPNNGTSLTGTYYVDNIFFTK